MSERRIRRGSLVAIGLLAFAVLFLEGFGNGVTKGSVKTPASGEQPTFLQVGEELEYKVSYSFFNIGTIAFKILSEEQRNGRTTFKAKAVIESNPSLNWLKEVHIRFYGEMDDSIFSYYWISEDSSKKGIDYHSLTFNYDERELVYRQGTVPVSGVRDTAKIETIPLHGRGQDGLSLFFYAREHARERQEVRVSTFIEDKEQNAYINFQNKIEDMDIDAVDYPVETVFLEGKADFVGVAGLTGGFRGWFSNDDARIPIVGRLNVWLGSIKVELKSWKRPGWQPPRYVEAR